MTQTNELVTKHHFRDLREQIINLKKENEGIIFDYEDAKGNKEARSHIFKMRKSKTAVTTRHKEKKAEAKQLCDELDAAKRELISDINEMIDVHAVPLREVEAKHIKEESEKQILVDWDEAIEKNEFFDMKRELARKDAEIKAANDAKLESERLESERIETERIQKERDEKIKKDAIEKAEREKVMAEAREKLAAQKAEKDKADLEEKLRLSEEAAKLAAEKAEQKRLDDIQAEKDRAKIEKEKIERERKQAELDAIQAAKDAEIKRLADIQAESDRKELEKQQAIQEAKNLAEETERVRLNLIAVKKAEQKEREANECHIAEIDSLILDKLTVLGISEHAGIAIIDAINNNEIPNITINY